MARSVCLVQCPALPYQKHMWFHCRADVWHKILCTSYWVSFFVLGLVFFSLSQSLTMSVYQTFWQRCFKSKRNKFKVSMNTHLCENTIRSEVLQYALFPVFTSWTKELLADPILLAWRGTDLARGVLDSLSTVWNHLVSRYRRAGGREGEEVNER